jgi:hypothetical protein
MKNKLYTEINKVTCNNDHHTGRVLETVLVTAEENSLVKNCSPVCPPGM